MFDSYCKSVQDNTAKYLRRKGGIRAQREEIIDIDTLIDLLPYEDEYPSHRFMVFADALSCKINSEQMDGEEDCVLTWGDLGDRLWKCTLK